MTGPSVANDPLSVREHVLASTYQCVARFGMAKTTIEDVVRESGVSRATIYRHFPGGRDEVVRETVGWEVGNFLIRLSDQIRDAEDLVALIGLGLRHAHVALREHELLQTILHTEPERLLGLLSTESAKTMPFIADFLYPYLDRERTAGRTREGIDLEQAADFVARMVFSLIGSAGRWNLDDDAALDDLVRHEILGGILV